MAQEEIQKPASSPVPAPSASVTASVPVKEVEVTAPAPEATDEKVMSEKDVPVPVPEPEVTAEKVEEILTGKEILQTESFKEEGYLASELSEAEKKALAEFKEIVREALNKREFTTPPPPPTPAKEEKKAEEKKEEKTEVETKEEVKTEETKTEEKTEVETKEEVKTEEKSSVPAAVETKKKEKLNSLTPIIADTKKALAGFKEIVREALNKREFTAPPAPPAEEEKKTEENKEEKTEVETKEEVKTEVETKEEVKTEEKSSVPAAVETKKKEKLTALAPIIAETKKEEKPAFPVTEEIKKEEKVVPVETTPAAPVVTEETKKEEKATASAPITNETNKEEEKAEVITIEKAFAADQEAGTKTVEAIEESIISITLPETAVTVEPEEVSIWGITLLEDESSDVILLKFLRARDLKVKEAFTMLKNTVQWRKDNNIDELVSEDLEGSEFEKMVFTHGVDKQGHVVIYSSYGEFQNKEIFSDKEKFNKFLKWRIQFQEKCVRSLDFSPEAKSSFLFVSDFRNAPGLGKRALWQFIRRAVKQFEDNYPEFVAKELFINVPWWYIPYYKTFGSIITSPRTRSKMVLSGPSKSTETIFKYVAPEVVPVKYGGLSKESPFTVEDGVTEAFVKSTSKYTIDLPASEGSTLSWELRVLGADVSYGAQFEPSNEASYTVIVAKNRKIGLTDEPVITDSFKVGEPGKVVITIDNQTSKKKKLLYRFKTQA